MAKAFVGTKSSATPVEFEGLDELIADLEDLPRSSRREFAKSMRRAGTIVAQEVKRRLGDGQRSGVRYLYDRDGVHKEVQASAPGEPPASITKKILKSIKVSLSKGGLSVRILSADRKAHMMEYGTIEHAAPAPGKKRKRVKVGERQAHDVYHVAPRPFLRPSLADKKPEVMKELENGVISALLASFRNRVRR